MLFAIKNRFLPTLLLALLLSAAASLARGALGIAWRLDPLPTVPLEAALGLGAILMSDGLLQGALLLAFRERYRRRYEGLVAYFRGQRAREILASGVLAGSEELFFRGVILAGLMQRAGWSAPAATAAAALAFGALHVLRDPELALFGVWAVWEGVLLGLLYLTTGSLLVVLLAHAAHDSLAFALMAWQRGRPSPPGPLPH
jgi:membrane protease YdiL (CAAX protease family)